MGQLPPGAVILVETEADALTVMPAHPDTRLDHADDAPVDDHGGDREVLVDRFPAIVGHKDGNLLRRPAARRRSSGLPARSMR
jgi:hypothetical protein